MQKNRNSKASDRNEQLRQQLERLPMPASNWEQQIYSAASVQQESSIVSGKYDKTAQLRQRINHTPVPEIGWEDKIYAAAQQENSLVAGKGSISPPASISPALGALGARLQDGLAARFLNSSYAPSVAVVALLLVTLYLQPIAAIYNSGAPANLAAADAVAYSDDVITTAQDVTVETLDSYVSLSQDALWDDSWLLND